MDPALLRSLADDLLDVAVAALTPDPLDEADPRTTPPDNQYVAHGLAFAWDCELVAVSIERLTLERAQGRGSGCAVIPAVTLAVTVLRCYPKAGDDGNDVPAPETIAEAARVLAVDAAALGGGILTAWENGTLFPSSPTIGCQRVTIFPGVDPLGPAGGFAGWRLRLDVRL